MRKIKTFTAIDFETAQGGRNFHTICQVGLVRVVKGKITDTISMLVQPPGNYYWYKFTEEVHGIDAETTLNSPTFDKIWNKIKPYIHNQHIVAHNASFDIGCLKASLEYYNLPIPEFTHSCTCNLYGRTGLAELCEEYDIELNHHDALSDAMACAELFVKHLNNM